MSALNSFKVFGTEYGYRMPVRTVDFIEAKTPGSLMYRALQELDDAIEKTTPGANVKVEMISTLTRRGQSYIAYKFVVTDPDL